MTRTNIRTGVSIFGLLGLVALSPTPVLAQVSEESVDPAIEPIIVTAQRREEAQVDVPISITNLSNEALDTANVTELTDIAKVTPGLRFDFAAGFVQPTIRGVGTAVTTAGGQGNVGIYIDGFYSPNPLATDFDLLSVESIQVLKGPQGTLFGRNTTGGAILVQTRDPDTDGNFYAGKASYGRFNELDLQSFNNFAISDRVALTVEGQYRTGDGYLTDITTGRDVGDFENWSLRFGMKAELTEGVELLVRYKHAEVDDPTNLLTASFFSEEFGLGAPFGGIPGTFTTNRRETAQTSVPNFFQSNSDVAQVTLRADVGFADFTSYSQYRNEKVDSSSQLSYSGLSIFQLGLPNNNETWSQEFLLNSKPGGALQWTAGLFYFENTDQYITFIDSPGNRTRLGGSRVTSRSYAAFADATYEITPRLFATVGLRYAYDRVDDAYYNTRFLAPFVDFNGNGVQDAGEPDAVGGRAFIEDLQPEAIEEVNDGRLTPRFVLRYKPTDNASVYASYTQGYKAAIIDVGGTCQNPPYVCSTVRPETIDAFELGAKYDGYGISAEIAGFYYDYKDLQVSLFEAGTAAIINAAQSEIYGLDAQVRYQLSPQLSVNAGATWVHARYKNFDNAPIYTPCADLGSDVVNNVCAPNGLSFLVLGQDLNNVTMQRTPEFTGNLGARYEAELAGGELALSGNLFYSSSFFFGPSGIQFKQDGYETLSLRAQWSDPTDRFYVALWGDNVTDSVYYTAAQYSNFGIGANYSKPVTYGIEVGFRFGS